MATDKKTLGTAFMQDLLARIPEAERSTPESLLAALQSEAIVEVVGEGALRQADYSREMNATQAYYRELADWHEKQKAKTPDPAITPNPGAPAGSPVGLTKEEADKLLDERERGQLAFLVEKDRLRDQHMLLFGEPLDVRTLVTDPEINKLGLDGVYQKLHGAKVAEKRTAAQNADIDRRVNERLAEERTKLGAQPPYPVASAHISALSGLPQGTPGISDGIVDAAVQAHNELVAARMRPTG